MDSEPVRRRARGSGGAEPNWRRVLLADPCPYCDAPSQEIDHIIPIAGLGPRHALDNLAGICRSCNKTKAHNSLLMFLLGEPARRPSTGDSVSPSRGRPSESVAGAPKGE